MNSSTAQWTEGPLWSPLTSTLLTTTYRASRRAQSWPIVDSSDLLTLAESGTWPCSWPAWLDGSECSCSTTTSVGYMRVMSAQRQACLIVMTLSASGTADFPTIRSYVMLAGRLDSIRISSLGRDVLSSCHPESSPSSLTFTTRIGSFYW